MRYVLTLAEDNRILSATYAEYAPDLSVAENTYTVAFVDELIDGDISDYRYVDGKYVYDPIPKPTPVEAPSQWDVFEAQLTYTAMMTDTLLEV